MEKQRIVNDDISLNFRVSKGLKAKILRQAQDQNVTMSKYLRQLLEDTHNGTYCDEIERQNEIEGFILSQDFIGLVIWVYSKSCDNLRKTTEDKECLDNYIRIIKRADSFLPKSLVDEFDKVLVDLYRIKTAPNYDSKAFNFVKSYEESKNFNFEILDQFFLKKSLEAHISQF